MEQKVVKFFETQIKSIDEGTHSITAEVSTKKVDRMGDIVEPEAFRKRLKHFKDHPVLLSSHNYNSLLKQIGEIDKVTITDGGLEAKVKYYVGMGNEEADWAWVLAQKGIASFSIGFMSHAHEDIMDKDKGYATGRKFTEVELLEVSQVLIPANREALQNGISFNQEESRLMELATKSFEAGELKEIAPIPTPAPIEKNETTPPPDVKSEAVKEDKQEAKHYTEAILGDGTIQTDKSNNLPKEDYVGAIKSGFDKALGKA